MRALNILKVAAAVFAIQCLAGCDTLMFTQYRLPQTASDADVRAKVMNSLSAVAFESGLSDATATSKVKDTVVYYTQPNTPHFRVDLGARLVDQDIVVDLVGGFGPLTDSFKKAEILLNQELSRQFGTRAQSVPPDKRIP